MATLLTSAALAVAPARMAAPARRSSAVAAASPASALRSSRAACVAGAGGEALRTGAPRRRAGVARAALPPRAQAAAADSSPSFLGVSTTTLKKASRAVQAGRPRTRRRALAFPRRSDCEGS